MANRIPLFLLGSLLLCTPAFAKDHSFQDGKLLGVTSQVDSGFGMATTSGTTGTISAFQTGHAIFIVQIDDLTYTLRGERTNRHSKDIAKGLIVGDSVKAAVDGDDVYLQLANGKELKTKMITRSRSTKL